MTKDYKLQIYTKVQKKIISYICNFFVVRSRNAQAMLVAIIVIFTATIAIGLAAAEVTLTQTQNSANQKLSNQAYNLAAAGIENTLMRFSRGDFTTPATLSDGTTSCTINISGSGSSYQILAVAQNASILGGKVNQKIQASVSVNNGVVTVTSYQKVY
jgi:hypothetical protein